ncbi:MAG: hypothetical protein Q8M76_03600 [Spirochaetaceae bacterium]|nr:hypothetical protein [Spirochaetaceae bacterium]
MKTELQNYSIFPKVVPAGRSVRIRIAPRGAHAAFDPEAEYLLRFMPLQENVEPLGLEAYPSAVLRSEGGELSFERAFVGEQEHYVRIYRLPDRKVETVQLSLYSLPPDLYERRPLRGDTHAHSSYSDGKEYPDIVAANYRKAGYDFMAITDHERWEPSGIAARAFAGFPVDLRIFPGEEVHAPGNHIHIVAFGGDWSVNELFRRDKAAYRREVLALMAEREVPPGVDAFEYAACRWVFDRIREAKGLGVFVHPHWISKVYHVPDRMTERLFENAPFDAFELIGGHPQISNNLQTAFYNDARARGLRIPIVGASDSHGTINGEWFDRMYTIVFALGDGKDDIVEAVKGLYSVAVEHYEGEHYRVYGPYRLVKFAIFLLEEYFPIHDELCFEEGRLMKELACGDPEAAAALGRLSGRTAALLDSCFGTLAVKA